MSTASKTFIIARKTLVGVIHLPPLPGSPRSELSMRDIVTSAVQDARTLVASGFDHIILENFGDAPFFKIHVPAITCAAMTTVAAAVAAEAPNATLGINVLRNDPETALAIASVVGAAFVRINVHVGARVTDQGVIEGDAANTLRMRRTLGAHGVAIWADVDVKHSAPLAPYDLGQETQDAVLRGLASTILVTGDGTGHRAPLDKLRLIKAAAGPAQVLVASGATVESLGALLGIADGVIVGTALRKDGRPGGTIDQACATAFAQAFRDVDGDKAQRE